MLNLLANLHAKIGDLNKIKSFVKLLAFVNSTDSFTEQPLVVNGASNLLIDIVLHALQLVRIHFLAESHVK